MAYSHGTPNSIVRDGLVFAIDPANIRSWNGPDSNTVNDLIGTNNGTIYNNTSGSYGINNSFAFDGADAYIDCGTSQLLDFNSSFTISVWTHITSTPNGFDAVYSFAGASNAFVMFFNNNGTYSTISFGSANHPTDTTIRYLTTITLNEWSNMVVVYNGSGISSASNYTFYINNSPKSLTTSAGFSDNGNVNYIGRYDASHDFIGNISSINVYNKALSASEVLQNYNALKGRFE